MLSHSEKLIFIGLVAQCCSICSLFSRLFKGHLLVKFVVPYQDFVFDTFLDTSPQVVVLHHVAHDLFSDGRNTISVDCLLLLQETLGITAVDVEVMIVSEVLFERNFWPAAAKDLKFI